jgi:hypothetical protein
MKVGAHYLAGEIHLREIDGFQIYNQVPPRLEADFWISAFYCW